MDIFRIKKFRNIIESRRAEYKLKELGIPMVLSDSYELYVSLEYINKALEALDLPPEVKNTPQPGPWCPSCGRQLVSKRGRFSSNTWLHDTLELIPPLINSLRSWYCHKCDDEIKNLFMINRLRRSIKRTLVNMGYHAKPAFIIIGAQKAGTTALFRILQQHPQIVAPARKELHFFDDFQIKYGDFISYHEMFPFPYQLQPDRLTFEASPSYIFNPLCAQRIYQYSPGIRLIVILREPISRAFSAWNMHRRLRHLTNPFFTRFAERRSFEVAIKQEIKVLEKTEWKNDRLAYVKRGIYVDQLERYLQYFSQDSLLILEYSKFMHDPQAFLARVFRFLKVDDQFVIRTERANVNEYEDEISKAARDILHSFYKPYNERLYALLGRTFAW